MKRKKREDNDQMSVVMGFVTQEFIVMCADKRVCRNGNIHSEDFRKVYYLNHNIIFGFAGSVLGNYTILSHYLEDFNIYSDDCFRVDFNKTKDISFEDACDTISRNFERFIEKHRDKEKIPDVSIMIAGFTETGSILRTFYVRDNKPMTDTNIGEKNALCHNIFGTKQQENILLEILDNLSEISINNIQKAFHEVIDMDSKANETINSKMNAVFVEKPAEFFPSLEMVDVSLKKDGFYTGKTYRKIKKSMRDQDEFYA